MNKGQREALEARNDRIDLLIEEYEQIKNNSTVQARTRKSEIKNELKRINALHRLYN